jgi:adenosylcobinamide-GDP ribazoletransferase
MAHGDRERRVRALTDRYLGTGGVAMGAAVLLITFSSLQALHPFAAALLTAEVGGQFAMVMLTCYGKPFHEGLHSRFYHDAKPFFPLAALALCLPLILLPLTPIQLGAAFSLMIATPLVLNAISNRLFGGVNGDVTGASHEITRAIILAAIALI